ncbi:MAG: acetate--CoA ligase family protein [Candidatus Thermoplasmatota archaeon]|nr:acetate--CoA ligase family protein [Candidatus Thermoplasmatota archaeon]MCL5955722.1 acetate--CoA ligase family protein [Candidatus Thermoplasmatota archaeon]
MTTETGLKPGMRNITEFEAKAILREYGIVTPRGIVFESLPDKIELKFPLVLKVSDASIIHKSDVGGVKAGIVGLYDLIEEYVAMKKRFPNSEFLLEEMAQKGVEFIVGVTRDPVFGPVIMLGTGGIYTELYQDVAFRKLPIGREDALDMIQEIRSGIFCKGFRGTRIDCEEIVGLLLKVNGMISGGKVDILSLDLNPVIVSASGAVAADAKISFYR